MGNIFTASPYWDEEPDIDGETDDNEAIDELKKDTPIDNEAIDIKIDELKKECT